MTAEYSNLPSWLVMWLIAVGIYATAKAASPRPAPALGYLFAYPGFDAAHFRVRRPIRVPSIDWLTAAFKMLTGAVLLLTATRLSPRHPDLPIIVGVPLFLHFGLLHLITLAWRRAGVPVPPVMNYPFRAATLADFWSRRWNTPFHTLATRHVFRPLLRRTHDPTLATYVTFLASGLVHELVISVPARAAYGLPTLYFLFQSAGLLLQRHMRFSPLLNRALTWAFLVCPLPLLFPPVFRTEVLVPFAHALERILP